jgi:hypothetical protein
MVRILNVTLLHHRLSQNDKRSLSYYLNLFFSYTTLMKKLIYIRILLYLRYALRKNRSDNELYSQTDAGLFLNNKIISDCFFYIS